MSAKSVRVLGIGVRDENFFTLTSHVRVRKCIDPNAVPNSPSPPIPKFAGWAPRFPHNSGADNINMNLSPASSLLFVYAGKHPAQAPATAAPPLLFDHWCTGKYISTSLQNMPKGKTVSRVRPVPRQIQDIKPKRQLPRSEQAQDPNDDWWY